jgi:hypothetical protein
VPIIPEIIVKHGGDAIGFPAQRKIRDGDKLYARKRILMVAAIIFAGPSGYSARRAIV